MKPNTQACARLKTAIAEEVGNIQGMSERRLAESDDYLINRIPQATFDPSQGEEPRKVRYSTAPVADTGYSDILTSGHSTQSDRTRGCDGEEEFLDAKFDKRGAFGCNLPGTSITGGYDEFTRRLVGKAWETEPFCAMDLLLKSHPNEYIAMLREDLPYRAREGFEYALQRNVIETTHYNTSVVSGFVRSRGAFPAAPEGVLDLFTVRRQFQLLEAQGWTGAREFGPISHEAFYTMRHNYKLKTGTEIPVNLSDGETNLVDSSVSKVEWAGINWVLSNKPLRGYLESRADGSLEFVPVRPTVARLGTGEGIVTDVNDDYFNCSTYCNGVKRELYEVGFAVSPMAATREAFAMPQIGGKQWENQMFNFQVKMIDGSYLDCNEDNFKGKFRLLHAYAFESLYPEQMGAVLFRVSPDCVNIVSPCCDDTCPAEDLDPVEIAAPAPPRGDKCSEADCEPCDPYSEPENQPILNLPTETEPCPENNEGIIALSSGGTLYAKAGSTVRLKVLRIVGDEGAASVHAVTVDGTATAGDDYTGVNFSGATALQWADGVNEAHVIEIPIDEDATPGQDFRLDIGTATGATLADGTNGFATVTIEIEDCPEEAPAE